MPDRTEQTDPLIEKLFPLRADVVTVDEWIRSIGK